MELEITSFFLVNIWNVLIEAKAMKLLWMS